MNITQVQSILAPMLAPVAPAVLFGNNLYHGMLSDGLAPGLAGVAAVTGTLGVELSGALACSMAVLAYHKRDYKIMVVSIIAAVIYAVFVMIGILQAENTATFAGAVVISLVAYLMLGVYQSYTAKLETQRAETELQVRSLKAETNKINAEARRAKVSESYRNLPESYGTDWRHVPLEDREKIAGMTTRQISEQYQVSERTALNWQKYAKE